MNERPISTPESSLCACGKPVGDLRLCDAAGMVAGFYVDVLNRLRLLSGFEAYDGEPFPCTGYAHLAGQHIRCISSAHTQPPPDALPERPEPIAEPLPEDLERLLRDPELAVPQDRSMHFWLADHLRRNPDATVTREAYLNLWTLYEKETS